MTDDDVLAEYIGAATEEERDAAARELADRGIDAADFDVLVGALRDEAQWVEPGADLEDRIMADVFAEADALRTASPVVDRAGPSSVVDRAGGSPVVDLAGPSPVVDLAERRARREARTFRRFAPKVVGVAAAVAIGMLLGRVRQSERRFDTQVALAATPLAPEASATVKARTEAAGVRIELSAHDLPDPPPGSIYEAWVSDGTTRVPIGTFSKGGDVVLWSGVALARYSTMTVTLEPLDGDASSSGKVVLRGTLAKP